MLKFEQYRNPTLRIHGLKKSWERRELGEFLSFKNGINAEKEAYGSGYKFINVLDIINNDCIVHDSILGSVTVDEKTFIKNEVVYGDVLFQRSSENRKEAGQSNVYLDSNKSATFGGFVIRGRAKKEFNSVYLHYLLKSAYARKEITTKSGGSTRYNVGQDTLSAVNIYICDDLNEQQKIADFLSAVDKKISQLKEKHALLQQYKKGVMQQIFTQQIRFKDDKGKAFADWKEKPLSSLLTLTLREIDKPEANYMAIGVRSHMKGTFQKLDFDPETIAMEKMYVVRHNDLIVNITFAWEGAIAIVKKEDDGGLVSHRFPTYTFKKGQAIHEYFRHIISFKRFKYMLDVISPGGAGRNRVLSKKDFLALRWNMPCVEEQKKIATFLDTLDTKINLVAQQIEQTQQFKKGLLQQMFV